MRAAADEQLQVRRRERLRQIVPRALAQHVHVGCDGRLAGGHDDERVGIRQQRGAHQRQPVDLRHAQVDQRDVERTSPKERLRLVAARDRGDVVAFLAQRGGAGLAQRVVLLGDDHADRRVLAMGCGAQRGLLARGDRVL